MARKKNNARSNDSMQYYGRLGIDSAQGRATRKVGSCNCGGECMEEGEEYGPQQDPALTGANTFRVRKNPNKRR